MGQSWVQTETAGCDLGDGIGILTVAGAPVPRIMPMAPFHQGLADTDCMSCHTDHPLASLTPPHSHNFAHAMLTPAIGAACSSCHTPPTDVMHVAPVAQCSSCHTQTSWAAAAIDHTRFFALTGLHDVACTSCHTTAGDFTRYTCFSCHEHQEADLIREHREEGISNITNCVSCHRDAHGEGGEGREGRDDDD